MALESDDNKAESRLSVLFYCKPIQNDYKSQAEGRPIFEDMDFVRISIPGDTTTTIDTYARDEHRKRFPLHWAHYQNTHGTDQKFTGTPLSQWPLLTASQGEELKAVKFYTVESIATASDLQLQKLGMLAGMSPHAFRERAQRYLLAAKDEAGANKQAEEIASLKKAQEESEAKHVAELQAMKDQIAALSRIPERKKPGRKPKNATMEAPAGA